MMIRSLLAMLAMTIVAGTSVLAVDDDAQPVVLTETVNYSFGRVWDAMQTAMASFGCGDPQQSRIIEPQDENSWSKGVYVSDFCMIVQGEDSTRTVMERYGELPRIRGGIWITGRIQYKISIKEIARNQTTITLKAELSGFEEFITNQVYFWVSNGELERKMMADIIALTNKPAE
jgi:hypothetical protein